MLFSDHCIAVIGLLVGATCGMAHFFMDGTLSLSHSDKTKDGRKITDDHG
jgi:hypothetical protein